MHDPAATGEGLRSGHWREMVWVGGQKRSKDLRQSGISDIWGVPRMFQRKNTALRITEAEFWPQPCRLCAV